MQSLQGISIHWLDQNPHMNSQDNKNMTTSTLTHSNHLQITQVMSLWVDIRVSLMFIVILIVEE